MIFFWEPSVLEAVLGAGSRGIRLVVLANHASGSGQGG